VSKLPRILIVDDEPQIQRFLRLGLEAAGYEALLASDGAEALRQSAAMNPDLVILDLGLPDMDGKQVLARLRQWSSVPVLVLSARDDEHEKIETLDLGANDYIAKPFGIGELLARIRAALRTERSAPSETSHYQIAGLSIDAAQHQIELAGESVKLTPKEFELLLYLAQNRGRVLTHRQLLAKVWGPAHAADTQYLRVFVGQLRQKLETDAANPALILTEPGVGYRIAPDD
jgi:two-component system, OmpR family, KDP operon response regulator KdpE